MVQNAYFYTTNINPTFKSSKLDGKGLGGGSGRCVGVEAPVCDGFAGGGVGASVLERIDNGPALRQPLTCWSPCDLEKERR